MHHRGSLTEMALTACMDCNTPAHCQTFSGGQKRYDRPRFFRNFRFFLLAVTNTSS